MSKSKQSREQEQAKLLTKKPEPVTMTAEQFMEQLTEEERQALIDLELDAKEARNNAEMARLDHESVFIQLQRKYRAKK